MRAAPLTHQPWFEPSLVLEILLLSQLVWRQLLPLSSQSQWQRLLWQQQVALISHPQQQQVLQLPIALLISCLSLSDHQPVPVLVIKLMLSIFLSLTFLIYSHFSCVFKMILKACLIWVSMKHSPVAGSLAFREPNVWLMEVECWVA